MRLVPAPEVEQVVADGAALRARRRPLLQEPAERRQARARTHHDYGRLRLHRQSAGIHYSVMNLYSHKIK